MALTWEAFYHLRYRVDTRLEGMGFGRNHGFYPA